jgi:hypothetical protein
MTHDEGGALIPASVADEITAVMDQWWVARGLVPPVKRPSLTLRERLRVRLFLVRFWFHDRLFPDCRDDDW